MLVLLVAIVERAVSKPLSTIMSVSIFSSAASQSHPRAHAVTRVVDVLLVHRPGIERALRTVDRVVDWAVVETEDLGLNRNRAELD